MIFGALYALVVIKPTTRDNVVNKFFKKSAIGLALGMSLIGTSNAALITVQDNLADPTYLSNGTYNGTFDLLSVLNPAEDYVSPYEITSAAILFSFSDDTNDISSSSSIRKTYDDGAHYSRKRTYERTTTNYDAFESIELGIADATFNDSTDYFNSGTTYENTTNQNGSYRHCSWGSCYTHSTYDTYNNYMINRGYTGDFTIGEMLDVSSLTSLLNEGTLDFSIFAQGDINLMHAELVVNIEKNQVSVPEPGSIAVLSLGLAGLYLNRRKKKKQYQ
jgi:hypothetical protein